MDVVNIILSSTNITNYCTILSPIIITFNGCLIFLVQLDGANITLDSTNATYDYIIVTFDGSFISYLHALSYWVVLTSHMTVSLLHLMVPLFLPTLDGFKIALYSTSITYDCNIVTLGDLLIFYSHWMFPTFHWVVRTSHMTVPLSPLVIFLFFTHIGWFQRHIRQYLWEIAPSTQNIFNNFGNVYYLSRDDREYTIVIIYPRSQVWQISSHLFNWKK